LKTQVETNLYHKMNFEQYLINNNIKYKIEVGAVEEIAIDGFSETLSTPTFTFDSGTITFDSILKTFDQI